MMDRKPHLPLRFVDVQMNHTERDHFIEQVRRFADQHRFDLNIRQLPPDPDEVFLSIVAEQHSAARFKQRERACAGISVLICFLSAAKDATAFAG